MKIDEINRRIAELRTSIDLLKSIKQDYINKDKGEAFINALDDGIRYTQQRLETYKTSNWVMLDE